MTYLTPDEGRGLGRDETPYTIEEALDRWPLARTVYDLLETVGVASSRRIARLLVDRGLVDYEFDDAFARLVDDVTWWMTFGHDNGAGRLVRCHLAIWQSDDGTHSVDRVFVYRADLADGPRLATLIAKAWMRHLDRKVEARR